MNRVRFPIAAIGLMLCSLAAVAQVPGAITTVNTSGTPQEVFSHKDEVFFTAGPTATPCAFTQFLNDGSYYFQVTDLSGTRLFSTDPVAERRVTIRNGVLFSYDGHTHVTHGAAFAPFLKGGSVDEQSQAEVANGPCGGIEVGLAPFRDAGDRDADYLLWLTPVGRFSGDPSQVDPSCGDGCFHGFRPQFSLTTAFRVEDKRFCEESFCVSGVKFEDRNGDGIRDSGEPGLPGVEIRAEGENGPILRGVTLGDGAFEICGLTSGQGEDDDGGGEFIVFEVVPFGYRQTGPTDVRLSKRLIARGRDYIVLGCNANFEGLDFANQLIPNAIGGIKFEDLDADGVRDPGEPGLDGFTITLTSTAAGGPAPQSVTTDANGNFLFLNVAPGTYTLSETFRQGFSLTVPANNALTVTLASGGSSIANVFGNFRGVLTGTITGAKFNDLNGNGVRDAGEPGIAGVTITRTSSINDPANVQLSVVTDAQGNFTFANVPFGTFTISETVPAGFVQTFPAAPGTASANVNFAQRNVTGLLFGNRAVGGTITGFKFNDLNGNGVRDAGEPGLAGVTIRRTASPSDPVGATLTVTTAADGAFTFSNIPLGTYTLSETVPAGFVQTAPPTPGTISVTVSAAQAISSNNLFGNRAAPLGVSGIKFNDLNGNGVRDAGEPGLAGVTIRLTNAAGVVTTATTDASGAFTFSGVAAGAYTVSELVPAGFQQTAPPAPGTFAVTVVAGQAVTGLLFGNRAVTPGAGSISGRKILDLNANGVFDATDRGFEGIVFELRGPGGNLIATATSDASGNFTFPNLPAGTYVLSEILPENFFQTFPGTAEAPGTYTITLTSGQAATGFLFLNKC